MTDAGRIGFLIKGEYDEHAEYDFLDVVYYGKSSYVAKKKTIGNTPQRNNEYWQIFAEGAEFVGVDIATNEKAGIVKPDGDTITIEKDGTIHAKSGDGGTVNYPDLNNLPQIEGIDLVGNKTLDDLNIQQKGDYLTEIPDSYVTQSEMEAYAQPVGSYATIGDIKDKLDKTGDVSNTTVEFEQASTIENIESGEKTGKIFGKISKFLAYLIGKGQADKVWGTDSEGIPGWQSVGDMKSVGAENVKFADGMTAEDKVGMIKGMTSDLNCEEEGMAASAVALKQVNDSLVKWFNRIIL